MLSAMDRIIRYLDNNPALLVAALLVIGLGIGLLATLGVMEYLTNAHWA
jgi:hypothetical protein